MIPKRIHIPSDDTELELVESVLDKRTRVATHVYIYTKAEVFLGNKLELTDERLHKMINNGVAKIINNGE